MKAPTFKDHIRELRNRLMIVAAVFLAASSAAYYFRDSLIHTLLNPIHGESLVYLTPGGGFNFIFLVSIYAGLSVSIPLILYQLYSFIRPTLPASSQKLGMRIFFLSILLMVSGILFAYVYAIPGALKFLYGFAESYVEASLTAESYLNFIVGYVLGLGAVFQLPLLLFIIHKIKPLTPIGLLKSERWVIVLAFVAAALITPTPDPMNQTIIAMPIILMYQFGVFAILYSLRKEKKAAKKALRARPITAQPALQNRLPQPAPKKAAAPAMMDIRQPAHQTVNTMSSVMPSAIKRPAPRLINDMRPARQTRPQNLVQQRSIQRPTLTQAARPVPRVQTRPMSIQQPSSGVHPLLLRKQLSL